MRTAQEGPHTAQPARSLLPCRDPKQHQRQAAGGVLSFDIRVFPHNPDLQLLTENTKVWRCWARPAWTSARRPPSQPMSPCPPAPREMEASGPESVDTRPGPKLRGPDKHSRSENPFPPQLSCPIPSAPPAVPPQLPSNTAAPGRRPGQVARAKVVSRATSWLRGLGQVPSPVCERKHGTPS